MDLTSEYDGDWSLFDNVENVTLVPISNDGVPDEGQQVANVKAIRSNVSDKSFQAFGAVAVQTTDLVFYLWEATTGSQVAEQGAVIVDAGGQKFNIVSVLRDPIIYQCLSRQIRANA